MSINYFAIDNKPVFIDWEYSRKEIVFYDVWLYLYDMYGQNKMTDPDAFYQNFNIFLNYMSINITDTEKAHLALLEIRKQFLDTSRKADHAAN